MEKGLDQGIKVYLDQLQKVQGENVGFAYSTFLNTNELILQDFSGNAGTEVSGNSVKVKMLKEMLKKFPNKAIFQKFETGFDFKTSKSILKKADKQDPLGNRTAFQELLATPGTEKEIDNGANLVKDSDGKYPFEREDECEGTMKEWRKARYNLYEKSAHIVEIGSEAEEKIFLYSLENEKGVDILDTLLKRNSGLAKKKLSNGATPLQEILSNYGIKENVTSQEKVTLLLKAGSPITGNDVRIYKGANFTFFGNLSPVTLAIVQDNLELFNTIMEKAGEKNEVLKNVLDEKSGEKNLVPFRYLLDGKEKLNDIEKKMAHALFSAYIKLNKDFLKNLKISIEKNVKEEKSKKMILELIEEAERKN